MEKTMALTCQQQVEEICQFIIIIIIIIIITIIIITIINNRTIYIAPYNYEASNPFTNRTKRFEDKGALTVLVAIREPKQKCLKSRLESDN